jgi:hypothetical protein
MPRPSDLCTCGHPYRKHRVKGGGCTISEYKGLNTKETGEKGNVLIADLGTICPCEKFTPQKPEKA